MKDFLINLCNARLSTAVLNKLGFFFLGSRHLTANKSVRQFGAFRFQQLVALFQQAVFVAQSLSMIDRNFSLTHFTLNGFLISLLARPSLLAPFFSALRNLFPSSSFSSHWFWWNRRDWTIPQRRFQLFRAALFGNTAKVKHLLTIAMVQLSAGDYETHFKHSFHVQRQNSFLANVQQRECNLEDDFHALA